MEDNAINLDMPVRSFQKNCYLPVYIMYVCKCAPNAHEMRSFQSAKETILKNFGV